MHLYDAEGALDIPSFRERRFTGLGILKRVGFADHFACVAVRLLTSYEPKPLFAAMLISSAPPAS